MPRFPAHQQLRNTGAPSQHVKHPEGRVLSRPLAPGGVLWPRKERCPPPGAWSPRGSCCRQPGLWRTPEPQTLGQQTGRGRAGAPSASPRLSPRRGARFAPAWGALGRDCAGPGGAAGLSGLSGADEGSPVICMAQVGASPPPAPQLLIRPVRGPEVPGTRRAAVPSAAPAVPAAKCDRPSEGSW